MKPVKMPDRRVTAFSMTPAATSGTVDLDMPLNANTADSVEINYLADG